MSNNDGGLPRRRSPLLWWIFGVFAGLAASATVLLYWLIRRDRLGSAAPGSPPIAPGPDNPPAAPSGCDDSCVDSCSTRATGVCDEMVDAVCEQPMNAVCDDVNNCSTTFDTCGGDDFKCSSTCGNTGDGCGSSGNNCGSTSCSSLLGGNGSDLLHLLTGGQIWFTTTIAPRDRITWPARLGISVIRGYQRLLSPRLGTRCRYTPSCSEYGINALRTYGALDGALMTIARIRRCTTAVPHGTLDLA